MPKLNKNKPSKMFEKRPVKKVAPVETAASIHEAKERSKKAFSVVRGMHDSLPKEEKYWLAFQHEAESLAEYFQFGRIETPILEEANLFVRSIGRVRRFRESPVDFGQYMKSDVQVLPNYKWQVIDGKSLPSGYGYNTYIENSLKYNIDLNKTKNSNEIVKAMRIGSLDYALKGCEGANPNKPVATWLQYNNIPVIYNDLYEGSSPKYPANFRACIIDDRDHMMGLFRVLNKRNISIVGWYCGQTLGSSNTQEDTSDTYSKIYEVISNLNEAGYVV